MVKEFVPQIHLAPLQAYVHHLIKNTLPFPCYEITKFNEIVEEHTLSLCFIYGKKILFSKRQKVET